MKNLKGKIFILVASVFTGFLIISNINLDGTTINFSSLNAVDYKKALDERNRLYKEIDDIENQNIEYEYKINEFKGSNPEQKKKLIEDMKNQLVDYSALSGISDIKGQGIVIKVNDGDIDNLLDTNFTVNRKIFHEDDMARMLNEIINAGGQAIAINTHRVLPKTAVKCYWVSIGFEDESSTVGPFYINVIGNPAEMKAYLLSDNSFVQDLLIRDIKVEIEEKDEIVIPKTKQFVESQYMKRYDNK